MRQTLIVLGLKEIFIVILLLALVIFATLSMFRVIANNYLLKHRRGLLDKTRPLSDKCIDLGNKLDDGMEMYWLYINQLGLNQKYNCSSSIVSNASNNTVKYIIKYTNIEPNEYSLERIDYCISWMKLYSQTTSEIRALAKNIDSQLPLFVRMFTFTNDLPYKVCGISYKISDYILPVFMFDYTSPAGRSSRSFEIEITIGILESIKSEIYAKISKSGHSRTQRSAMTNDLREAIKKRDNYTCCQCGNSVFDEPNLLLEVDHIIPIAKGGKTEASNLQTLCWRCNRAKSDRI